MIGRRCCLPEPSFSAATMKFVRFIMKNAALASVPKHIEHFSKFSPSPLSMKQFLDFGEYRSVFRWMIFGVMREPVMWQWAVRPLCYECIVIYSPKCPVNTVNVDSHVCRGSGLHGAAKCLQCTVLHQIRLHM